MQITNGRLLVLTW